MSLPKIIVKNQFGEEAADTIIGGLQSLSTALPAKSEVVAITAEAAATAITIALATSNTYSDAAVNAAVNAALVTVVAKLNAIITQANSLLAALQQTT